jgi:hypothetical protein
VTIVSSPTGMSSGCANQDQTFAQSAYSIWRLSMKVGDLVRWRTNGDMGIIFSVKKRSLIGGENVLYIEWLTGEPTGPLPDDHACLEVISESR